MEFDRIAESIADFLEMMLLLSCAELFLLEDWAWILTLGVSFVCQFLCQKFHLLVVSKKGTSLVAVCLSCSVMGDPLNS